MERFEGLVLEKAPTTVRGGGRNDWNLEKIREFLEYLRDLGRQVVYVDTRRFFEQFKVAGKGYEDMRYPGWTARKILMRFKEEYNIEEIVGGNKVLTIKFKL